MNDFLQKLLRLKTPIKIAATAGLILIIVGIYGGLFYLDIQDQIKGARTRQQQLKAEKDNYLKRQREYQAYRSELTQLQQEQRELLKALPKKAEIPTFLSNIQEQAITKFFKNLSELPRIVNVENLSLGVEKQDLGGSPRLRAKFIAATFRYRDQG
jgi:Tfp pilus assembly protein PilO